MTRIASPSRKNVWSFLALGLVLGLGAPVLLLWASRAPQTVQTPGADNESRIEQELARQDAQRRGRRPQPVGNPRPAEFSPFGDRLASPHLSNGDTNGFILTPLGHLDPAHPDDLLRQIPPRLLYRPGEVTPILGRGALAEGLNYLMLRKEAIAERPLEDVTERIQRDGTIVGYLPSRTLVVLVDPKGVDDLRADPDVAFFHPVHPAYRLALDIGRQPLIEKARAADPWLLVDVVAIPGSPSDVVEAEIKSVHGVRDVIGYGADGSAFQVRVHFQALPDLARARHVMYVEEEHEFMLANAENAPTVQVGSFEDSLGIRPFDDAGVDGGGIDTNLDGRRINDGSDTVPPQIVGVTDNGISVDTPSFSQTATQTTTLTILIGPAHRKVHSIQPIVDATGSTCDGQLSGAGTHGNVVASTIAAYPSQLGVFATRGGIGGPGEPRGANLDGVARGARIIMQDVGDPARCTVNELVEKGGNVQPGRLLDRMNQLICPKSPGTGACAGLIGGATEVHLAILPFGVPNFQDAVPAAACTYQQEAVDLDQFLYNNRDFTIVVPVGNYGERIEETRPEIGTPLVPDLFDCTAFDDDPLTPRACQVSPPATAKNIISVGSHRADCMTFFGTYDCENRNDDFSSRGPATPQSCRMAPVLMGPGSDLIGEPWTSGVAVFRSRDNDNLPPVDAQLDEGNFGTSYAAGYVTGAAAVVRDYFAQGFYPAGERNSSDRVPQMSGALVKAALLASANFNDIVTTGADAASSAADRSLRRTRGMDLGSIAGTPVGVMGNSEQGYGRAVLTQVLPLSNWSDDFVLNPNSVREHPAAGLLAWDHLATGEPVINNTTVVSMTHTFRIGGPNFMNPAPTGPTRVVRAAELRIGLAWPDVPSAAGSGGPLVNDLDLVLESPGPDGCLFAGDIRWDGATCGPLSPADNLFYDGNVYDGGHANAITDQWSRARAVGAPERHDMRDPQEGIHLTSDPNADRDFSDSPLYIGLWRVTVKRGAGGAVAGMISNVGLNEDVNQNGRLDPGEDTDGDGLLDLGGQDYGLVVSGPVYLAEPPPPLGPSSFPQSSVSFDRSEYTCADDAVLKVFNTNPSASPSSLITFTVVNAAGTVLDTETNIGSTANDLNGRAWQSSPVPVRLIGPPVPDNGILEADTGAFIVATYAPAGQRPVTARAAVRCSPNLVNGFFTVAGGNAVGGQDTLGQGCDNDEFLDAGETAVYGVALLNRSRSDDYTDVVATLTPSGTGASAVRVLDSPKNLGRLPEGGINGVFFHVFVDPVSSNALAIANRRVTLTLTLESSVRGVRLGRQSYAFTHAINADRETFHYSTDYPLGGQEVRDLNRNRVPDSPDVVDPFIGIVLPDEDVTFSSMMVPGDALGQVTNTLGEDRNGNIIFDPGEEDVIPNGFVDGGILRSCIGGTRPGQACMSAASCPGAGATCGVEVPWNFDTGTGGLYPFRHPGSKPGETSGFVTWERPTTGVCGYQTSAPPNYGIWHTGDGDPSTPAATATACDDPPRPVDPATPAHAEYYFDILESPIIAKVHQIPDARGFPYAVEFQRLGANLNMDALESYSGGSINIDNDIDNDNADCMLCQELDAYYARRQGGWPSAVFRLSGGYRRTFSPTPGFPGISTSGPIPPAPPDFLPFPAPGSTRMGVCVAGSAPGTLCSSPAPVCPGGGTCLLETINAAGPVRNFEATLIGFEGGFSSPVQGIATPEFDMFFPPGPGGNRWQIGFGFYNIEAATPSVYGLSVDDLVFEWDEWHPLDESQFAPPHVPACSRFGGIGQPAGGQCATVTADRTNLYDCEESLEITVFDSKLAAGTKTVQVSVATDSDSVQATDSPFLLRTPTGHRFPLTYDPKRVTDSGYDPAALPGSAPVQSPGAFASRLLVPRKSFDLFAVPGSPGLFRGRVPFSSAENTATNVFTNPGTDTQFAVFYVDPLCDADRDGSAGESSFANIDGDNVPTSAGPPCAGGATTGCSDNCPFLYNPAQTDGDGDGVGELCDNCPSRYNPRQEDANADGVGDACDFDDLDCDGVENMRDNCPDVFNPDQATVLSGTRGTACDSHSTDRDGDGVADADDNCVLTPNPTQIDADGDGVGDACDGDCQNVALSLICSNDPTRTCSALSPCVSPGVCQCVVRHAAGSCSVIDDDADVDGVADTMDDCPTIFNPAIVPGTNRQLDSNRNGLGDACDPLGSQDGDFNGVPDDIVTFSGSIDCAARPLASLAIQMVSYNDCDGDNDIFPDPGETGRVKVTIKNLGPALTGATFYLTSNDPNVAFISGTTIVPTTFGAGVVPAGATLTLGDGVCPPPASPAGFTFKTGNPQSVFGADPATLQLCVSVVSRETLGTSAPLCFSLQADLDIPAGATQICTAGPDGALGTADDGLILEGFDVDRNSDGQITVDDTFRNPDGTHGFFLRTSLAGGGDVLAGVPCGGFLEVSQGNAACHLDPECPMDWHIHCPPGAACPHTDSGPCLGAGCSFDTPANGSKALSSPNSLHLGAHFDLSDSAKGDTVHLRSVQAFVTSPINLALLPGCGNLQMSFAHIADLTDNHSVDSGSFCVDCGDVQIQVDRDPDARADNWGPWEKLVPFQNVYDHQVAAWSWFGPYYCEFTPGDTGPASPSPRGAHETMCFPLGAWSHCGSVRGTTVDAVGDCAGPGLLDSTGTGVWVESMFDLRSFLGQRVRIRWIGSMWAFDSTSESYAQIQPFMNNLNDDGWWIDNIKISGTIASQVTPIPDPTTIAGAPAVPCNPAVGDRGMGPTLVATDVGGTPIDGLTGWSVAGQPIRLSAFQSTAPGGCPNGAAQFRFFKNGAVVQDWSSNDVFEDSPVSTATYAVMMRCSSDFTCTSQVGASVNVPVYSGDGGDVILGSRIDPFNAFNVFEGVSYLRGACNAAPPTPCNSAADCANLLCSTTSLACDYFCTDGVNKNKVCQPQTQFSDCPRTCVGGSEPPGTPCTWSGECPGGGTCPIPSCTPDTSTCPGGTCSVPQIACLLGTPADDHTIVRWWAPRTMAVDLYRGTIGSGISKGTLVTGPYWQLDTTGGTGSVASCLIANVPPTTCSVGCNGTSGPLDLGTDPNPALGFATYYLAALNAPAPNNGSVNALGCANPGICRGGTAPGAACSANSNCGTGGTCLLAPSSAFSGSFNGCVPAGDPSKVVEQAVMASLCP